MNNNKIDKDIKILLENGIITEEEYDKIVGRLNDCNNIPAKTYRTMLKRYEQSLLEENVRSSATTLKNLARQYITFAVGEDKFHLDDDINLELFTDESARQFVLYSMAKKELTTVSVLISRLKRFLLFLNKRYDTNIDMNNIYEFSKIFNKKLLYEKYKDPKCDVLPKKDIYFISDLGDTTNKLAILLCYEACMSRNELSMAKFEDVDYKEKVIHVRDESTGEIIRTMDLPDELCKTIKIRHREVEELLEKYNEDRQRKRRPPRPYSDYIFQSKKSPTASVTTISNKINSVTKIWYEYNYNKTDHSLTLEEFKAQSTTVNIPIIRFSKMAHMLEAKEWTLYDIVEKYGLGDAYYMEKKTGRFVDN